MNDKDKVDYLRYKLKWWKAKLGADLENERKHSRNLQRCLNKANRQIMRVQKVVRTIYPQ